MTEYTKYRREHELYDFTDLLENYIKEDFVEDVDVVCLDEMQDSTPLQWRVVFNAFRNAEHIYIAGDDKQAIYQFAGASPDILVNMKGNQHILDTSYRVPSKILDFAASIASEITVRSNAHCKAIKQGGTVDYLTSIDELDYIYDKNKTIFLLARNNKFLSDYVEWCKDRGISYMYKGEPVFSSDDKFQYKYGMTDTWSHEKLLFAQDCEQNGTFYEDPKVNISTIHSVKGDEADIVVLMGDISKIVAQQMDIDEDTEHRSFYVGVTRAKEKLFIIEPQTKLYYPYLY
jgi:superfamily I DNA/RNA helicase